MRGYGQWTNRVYRTVDKELGQILHFVGSNPTPLTFINLNLKTCIQFQKNLLFVHHIN